MEPQTKPEQETETGLTDDNQARRRDFLKKAGKATIVTPAAVTLVLAAGTKKTMARP